MREKIWRKKEEFLLDVGSDSWLFTRVCGDGVRENVNGCVRCSFVQIFALSMQQHQFFPTAFILHLSLLHTHPDRCSAVVFLWDNHGWKMLMALMNRLTSEGSLPARHCWLIKAEKESRRKTPASEREIKPPLGWKERILAQLMWIIGTEVQETELLGNNDRREEGDREN